MRPNFIKPFVIAGVAASPTKQSLKEQNYLSAFTINREIQRKMSKGLRADQISVRSGVTNASKNGSRNLMNKVAQTVKTPNPAKRLKINRYKIMNKMM